MIIIKNKLAIEKMKTAGKILAEIMNDVKEHIVPGKNSLEIDAFIEKKIIKAGLKPECKGYAGYKFATCISLNEVIVHGQPSKNIILKSGDFVKIDVVGSYMGYCADIARYFFIEPVNIEVKKIALAAQISLDKALDKAIVGNKLFDISACIQEHVEKEGFSVIRDFAGHGIGKIIHEAPDIPNYGFAGTGPVLREGMSLAIEPMIAQFDYKVNILKDGWTAVTADGGLAAHVEDTVVITDNGPLVITRP